MRRRTARGRNDEPGICAGRFIVEPPEGGLPSLSCPRPGSREEEEPSARRAYPAANESVEADVAASEDGQQPGWDAREEFGSTRTPRRESHGHAGTVARVTSCVIRWATQRSSSGSRGSASVAPSSRHRFAGRKIVSV